MAVPLRARASPSVEGTATGPVEDSPRGVQLGVLGRDWSALILRTLGERGPTDSTGLAEALPAMPPRRLSVRLRELVREGYLVRSSTPPRSPRGAYLLTAKGEDALPILRAFSELLRRYDAGSDETPGRPGSAPDLERLRPDPPHGSAGSVAGVGLIAPRRGSEGRPRVLVYKPRCEKCAAPLRTTSLAYTCTFECTWCAPCADRFGWVCPNCGGLLSARPVVPFR